MILKKWERLPDFLKTDAVLPYYRALEKKRGTLFVCRLFDVIASAILLAALSWLFIIIALAVKIDSRGPVFYRQERVTQYGRRFKIFKFRTMVQNADKAGPLVTVGGDSRITRVGRFLRRLRLDELPQLIDILRGTMSFVGTRPEVPRYVDAYTDEMLATLLLPAGVTSLASICYKDEGALLADAADADGLYIEKILPEKMRYNLAATKNITFFGNIRLMIITVFSMLGADYSPNKEKEKLEV